MEKREVPTFDDAVDQLKTFLGNCDIFPQVRWIFREDVAWRDGNIFINEPLDPENVKKAKALFDKGRARDLGVRIETLCLLHSNPCSYVWVPADSAEAEQNGLLMSKFIISIPTNVRKAESIGNSLKWFAYKLFEKPPEWVSNVDRVPSRIIKEFK